MSSHFIYNVCAKYRSFSRKLSQLWLHVHVHVAHRMAALKREMTCMSIDSGSSCTLYASHDNQIRLSSTQLHVFGHLMIQIP